MKKLLAILAALAFAGATAAMAADDVKAGGPTDKPGRAAEAGKDSVKTGGPTDKPGRAADEEKKGKKKSKKK